MRLDTELSFERRIFWPKYVPGNRVRPGRVHDRGTYQPLTLPAIKLWDEGALPANAVGLLTLFLTCAALLMHFSQSRERDFVHQLHLLTRFVNFQSYIFVLAPDKYLQII